eukprot:746938-Hanusia_phi.AAC.6
MKDLTLDTSLLGTYQQSHGPDARRDSASSSSSPARLNEVRRDEFLNKSWELQRLGDSSSLVENIRSHVS